MQLLVPSELVWWMMNQPTRVRATQQQQVNLLRLCKILLRRKFAGTFSTFSTFLMPRVPLKQPSIAVEGNVLIDRSVIEKNLVDRVWSRFVLFWNSFSFLQYRRLKLNWFNIFGILVAESCATYAIVTNECLRSRYLRIRRGGGQDLSLVNFVYKMDRIQLAHSPKLSSLFPFPCNVRSFHAHSLFPLFYLRHDVNTKCSKSLVRS